jgi:hypothetical protein
MGDEDLNFIRDQILIRDAALSIAHRALLVGASEHEKNMARAAIEGIIPESKR